MWVAGAVVLPCLLGVEVEHAQHDVDGYEATAYYPCFARARVAALF